MTSKGFVHVWVLFTSQSVSDRELKILGSFSKDDGNGNDNVTSKHKFALVQSIRYYSKLFNETMVWQSLQNETDMIQA